MKQNNRNFIYENYKLLPTLFDDGGVFVCFDTETTGLHHETDNVIEIGAVKFDSDGVLDKFETLINPQKPIPKEVTKINHITDEMVASCPTVAEVLPKFDNFISGTTLLAHNANFDLYFVNEELDRCGMKPICNKTVDTLKLAKWVYPKLGCWKLQFLAQTFGINVENAHRADDDARVCMEFFLKCLDEIRKM